MKNFKKILLLSNFLLIISLDNSFAEFKFSEDFETASDFNKTAPKEDTKINTNNSSYNESRYEEIKEEAVSDSINIIPKKKKVKVQNASINPSNYKKIDKKTASNSKKIIPLKKKEIDVSNSSINQSNFNKIQEKTDSNFTRKVPIKKKEINVSNSAINQSKYDEIEEEEESRYIETAPIKKKKINVVSDNYEDFQYKKPEEETELSYIKTAPIREKEINVVSDNYQDFQYKKAEEENKIISEIDYNNIEPFDEYFLNNNANKIKNNSKQTIIEKTQPKNPSKKIIKTKKIVKYLKDKNLLTIGNYFGIDYLNANLKFREMSNYGEVFPYNSPDLKNGFGLKYFYAVNFNNFFMAPEIFYEKIGVKNKYSHNRFLNFENNSFIDKRDAYGYKFMEVNQRYGGKINIGYDFNSNFSPYFFGGLSYIDYTNLASPYSVIQRNKALQDYNFDVFKIKKGRKLVPFYGYGLKVKLSNRFYLNAEYHILDFMVSSKAERFALIDNTQNIPNANFINLDNSLRIFKAGLLYNF